jgi:hypothetical protein
MDNKSSMRLFYWTMNNLTVSIVQHVVWVIRNNVGHLIGACFCFLTTFSFSGEATANGAQPQNLPYCTVVLYFNLLFRFLGGLYGLLGTVLVRSNCRSMNRARV